MGTEAERQDTRKAMAFDLCNIIDEDPSQETYTKEEIKKIITYIMENYKEKIYIRVCYHCGTKVI